MTRFLMPIILVAAAIGLFVIYTDPSYQASKAVAAQVSSYDDALTKSQQLKAVRDQLISKRNTFSPDDVTKLTRVLPDNVDNIRLIIDINNIAARHNLSLQNVLLGTVDSANAAAAATRDTSGDPVGSVTVGFSVNASYDNMLAFLQDLEHSLRIIDVQDLTFTAGAGGATDYTFSIQTYWLH